MDLSVEEIKQADLVDFLSRHYGLRFLRRGAAFACRSPFGRDLTPSFFVRRVGRHWLFKDFSIGVAGTIFDFVRMKENQGGFAETLAFIRKLLPGQPCDGVRRNADQDGRNRLAGGFATTRPYDIQALYERFRREDPGVCRRYLLHRALDRVLVDDLIRSGTVVHNPYRGRSYCGFAVRDQAGMLRCLDNHAVDGKGKFVLGSRIPFSLEWKELDHARVVFLAEGIIDYLSVKTLDGRLTAGLALLGNQLCFDRARLAHAEVLLSALDGDRGGHCALRQLEQRYPDKQIRVYDLAGHKDPNELLMALRARTNRPA